MVFDPFAGWGDSNTKLAIVKVLNTHGALSAKKIHHKLKKDFGISISYQATHKALKKMNEEKVLDCMDREFRINDEWVVKMKSFVADLEKTPSKIKDVFSKLDEGRIVSFSARNEAEMGYFVLDFMKYYSDSGMKSPLTMNLHFVWTILPLNDEQFALLKSLIKENGIYIVSRENTEYDRIMRRHWQDAGGKVKIGVKDAVSNCDVISVGDYMINIYWNPEHLDMAIKSTLSIKKESDLNYNELYELISSPTKIDFIVMKNKDAAEKIRKTAMGHF